MGEKPKSYFKISSVFEQLMWMTRYRAVRKGSEKAVRFNGEQTIDYFPNEDQVRSQKAALEKKTG